MNNGFMNAFGESAKMYKNRTHSANAKQEPHALAESGEARIGDIHVHTKYSGFTKYSFAQFPDCVAEPNIVVKTAMQKKIDVLCVTDHNNIIGAVKAKKFASQFSEIEVVIGEEISTADGEVIGLFLREKIDPGFSARETIDKIHDQDGIAISPHPFSPHCPSLGKKLRYLNLDGVEVFNSMHRDHFSNRLAYIENNNNEFIKANMGGSDAHYARDVGNGYTIFSGNDFKKSILKKETLFGGGTTPLQDCILWSLSSSFEITKATYRTLRGIFPREDPIHLRINRIKKRNKILGLIGSAIYLMPPIPLVSGLIGEMIIRKKARRIWFENQNNKDKNRDCNKTCQDYNLMCNDCSNDCFAND